MTQTQIGNELVFGLISPLGTDTNLFQTHLENILREYNYELEPIKISSILEFSIESKSLSLSKDEFERKIQLIDEGDFLRDTFGLDILASLAISNISWIRHSNKKKFIGQRRAFLINGLKHYKEIETLRSLYGTSFFLIGLNAPEENRKSFLVNQKHVSPENADALFSKDQDNSNKHGQKLNESFHRADVFIPFDNDSLMDGELRRFIDLVFGYPYHTPRIDEHMMFQAYAASLRSADLSRQVGAVISNKNGDLISSGANDVPRYGGGQYWSDDSKLGVDQRDYVRKFDSNKQQKSRIIEDVVSNIVGNLSLKECIHSDQLAKFTNALKDVISKSDIKSITEYGRAVHAEMAAITTSSRLGISAKDCNLYTTTFPCHNCAKHIIAAGIKRVVYVEPYPKSLAFVLHGDAASINNKETHPKTVIFEPFIGIGPRRFFDLFSMTLSNGDEIMRNRDGVIIDFEKTKSTVLPRIRMNMASIIDQEISCAELHQTTFSGGSNDKVTVKRKKELSNPKRKNEPTKSSKKPRK